MNRKEASEDVTLLAASTPKEVNVKLIKATKPNMAIKKDTEDFQIVRLY